MAMLRFLFPFFQIVRNADRLGNAVGGVLFGIIIVFFLCIISIFDWVYTSLFFSCFSFSLKGMVAFVL